MFAAGLKEVAASAAASSTRENRRLLDFVRSAFSDSELESKVRQREIAGKK